MEWEFTQATNENVDDLVKLVNSAYRGESSKKGWTTEADLLDGQRTDADAMGKQIEEENSFILIAQETETENIDGCVHLKKEGDRCYLGMLTVTPELQGKGLGKFLVEEAEAFADMLDCTEMYMTVISKRTELIEWYERRGYEKTDETRRFPYGDERFGIPKTDDLQFVILKKNIKLALMN
jgi:ribosomal protein S18 acetylase RimI-like enzyme